MTTNANDLTAQPPLVEQAVLDDLRRRLRAMNRATLPEGTGWARGVDTDYLTELVSYWADSYDWRVHEERIRSLPWATVDVAGTKYRVLHHKSSSDAATVVLLHGWPDSVLRYERVLPLLADLNVVVPALPGFPFAPPLTQPGMSIGAMAEVVEAVMSGLGYQSYIVSAGDVGTGVAEALAVRAPHSVLALHLTDVFYTHQFMVGDAELAPDEQAYLAAGQRWQMTEGAYALEQASKPHTLAVALGDSPAGLLAWIVEKLRAWSDCGGDVESVFPREDLLTWVTAYWVTGTIGTSFSPYAEESEMVAEIATPTVMSIFQNDHVPPPRAFVERFFDVRVWDEQPSGGHFAAWEQPQPFVAGLRTAVGIAVKPSPKRLHHVRRVAVSAAMRCQEGRVVVWDVVIVGGGPSGLMLACELSLAGGRPVVLERLAQPPDGIRANGLVGQVVRMLDRRGLYQRLTGDCGIPRPAPRFFFGALPLDLATLDDNPFYLLPVPQPRIQQVLDVRAAELGVEVRRGHELTGLSQRADEVIDVNGPQGRYEMACRYVVGADGGHSTTRELAGIGFGA